MLYFHLRNACMPALTTTDEDGSHRIYAISVGFELSEGKDDLGRIHAISASTGRTEWLYEQRASMTSLVATGGGLLFGGDANGRFMALDQRTGEMLWKVNLGSPVTGLPMIYTAGGRQYVAVSTGSLIVKRLSILTPDRRAKLTPLSGTAEVVPVANRGDPRGFVERLALRGAKPRGGYLLTHRGNRAAGTAGAGSGAVLETPALVAGLDDLAMMGETVEQRGGHLGVAEDGWPFAEGEVGGDDDRGSLVEPAHQVEEQLPAGLSEGQVAEFVEDDEVASDELVCGAALASGAEFGLEVVDQVDDVVAAAACTLSDAGPRDGDGEMGLAGAGAADEHDVALALQEAAAGELLDQGLVDGRGGEVEVGQRRRPSAAWRTPSGT